MALSVLPQTPTAHPFSSLSLLTGTDNLHLHLRRLSLHPHPHHRLPCPPIRMGGGPRTFPGGVSKWQWKRMQAKKAKQLLKARLLRERQIYEMRKRTELRAAVSELERPWEEVAQRAPNLFSVCADDQLKTLADRFQRPGGFDMWSERDGPQVFRSVADVPSDRFFPKGAVHSVKPYGAVDSVDGDLTFDDQGGWFGSDMGGVTHAEEQHGEIVGRNRYSRPNGGRNGGGRGNGRMNAGRVSLRPSADLYDDDGGFNGMRESSGVRSSARGSTTRRQISEESSRFESYVAAIGNGQRQHGKNAERDLDGRGNHQLKAGRVSLPPTADFYAEDGRTMLRDSKWVRGSGSRRTRTSS